MPRLRPGDQGLGLHELKPGEVAGPLLDGEATRYPVDDLIAEADAPQLGPIQRGDGQRIPLRCHALEEPHRCDVAADDFEGVGRGSRADLRQRARYLLRCRAEELQVFAQLRDFGPRGGVRGSDADRDQAGGVSKFFTSMPMTNWR